MRKRACSSVYKHNPEFDRVTRRRARMSENNNKLITGKYTEFDGVTRKRARMSEKKGDPKSKDRISQLPDDLLITILSLLPAKDAVAAGTLSRRWRNLWTYTRGINFEAKAVLYEMTDDPYLRAETERRKYINRVNLVLRKHRSITIDSFRICFNLDLNFTSAIDRWIKFAIRKRVQRLEVDLSDNIKHPHFSFRNYTFTEKLLTQLKRSSSKSMCTSSGIKFLKMLYLDRVNMSEKTLQDILVCCPALQSLSLHEADGLVDIKICGQYLQLRALEIVFCTSLRSIEICDTKLVSFTYLGPGRNVVLKDVPNLKEVSIQQGLYELEDFNRTLQNCFHQIQVFSLFIYRPQESIEFEFPKLHNVKQLSLKVGACNDVCLLQFTSLVKACPLLETFMLQLIWTSPAKRRRKIRQAANFPHKHLRLVKISGYYGRTSDAELALYFIQNAVQLNKMVIDPREHITGPPVDKVMWKKEEAARNHAKQHIAPKVPAGVNLVIL